MRIEALALITSLVFAPAHALASDVTAPEGAAAPNEEGTTSQETPDAAAAPSEGTAPSDVTGTADAEPETPADPGSASAGSATGTVARSSFTTDVLEREPVDRVDVLSDDQSQIFFFTELLDLTGQTVVHRWEYDGKVIAEVPFEVKGPRWRVYSKKQLLPEWKGDWTVTVLDAQGDPLDSAQFTYAAKTPPTPAPSPASPLAEQEQEKAEEQTPPAAPAD